MSVHPIVGQIFQSGPQLWADQPSAGVSKHGEKEASIMSVVLNEQLMGQRIHCSERQSKAVSPKTKKCPACCLK